MADFTLADGKPSSTLRHQNSAQKGRNIVLRTFAYALTVGIVLTGCGAGVGTLPSGGFSGAARHSYGADVLSGPAAAHIIYDFHGGTDGSLPVAGLISDGAGALYGTTYDGGSTGCGGSGCGSVYKLTPSGKGYKESILYAFAGAPDGQGPSAGLTIDSTGALYGTTYVGGNGCLPYGGCGTVFKLTPSGSAYSETVLYSFQHANDGAYPSAKVIVGSDGALYGTAEEQGAYGGGTVFKLKTSGSGFKVIYSFRGGTDGSNPVSGLLAQGKGALYGTTASGGPYDCGTSLPLRCGTVFELTPTRHGYSERVLYSFRGGTTDGQFPQSDLIADKQGALYGTTHSGGTGSCTLSNPPGCGTIFKLTPSGSGYRESLLYSFLGGTDGEYPGPGFLVDDGKSAGHLYGGTFLGGNSALCSNGCGTIFALNVSGSGYTESVLYRFKGAKDGANPYGALLLGPDHRLFGITGAGGSANRGTVFRLKT
jgi:uncharacterized repeat protein (TIGR03803 family)